MSTLFEQLLYTTLRIECKDNDGNLTGIGTGFLLSRSVSGDKYKLYLVSNKHILIGTPKFWFLLFARRTENRSTRECIKLRFKA